MVEMSSVNIGKPRVPLIKLVLMRELVSKTSTLRTLNSKILRASITTTNGLEAQCTGRLTLPEECYNLVYSDGHLLCRTSTNNSKCLKIVCLNGPKNKVFVKSVLLLPHPWMKDQTDFCSADSAGATVLLESSCYRFGLNSILYFITTKSINSLDMKAGKLRRTVDLPDGYEFSNLSLDVETSLMAVASKKMKRSDTLMAFALYQCDPSLMFQQLLEIKTSMFGNTLTGAKISQGILFTIHEAIYSMFHEFRFYSLSAVCQNQKRSAPPVLRIVQSYMFGVMNIGTYPFLSLEQSDLLKFRVRDLHSNKCVLNDIVKKTLSLSESRTILFHPDGTPRLILADGGTMQVFNIYESSAVAASTSAPIPTSIHSLDRAVDLAECLKTTAVDGKIIKKRSNSAVLKKNLDGTSLLAWDYESNMDILGVLYARLDRCKNQDNVVLILELLDSSSCRLLRRIKLDQLPKTTPNHYLGISLKLDADLCVVSMRPSYGRGDIRVYRFNRTGIA